MHRFLSFCLLMAVSWSALHGQDNVFRNVRIDIRDTPFVMEANHGYQGFYIEATNLDDRTHELRLERSTPSFIRSTIRIERRVTLQPRASVEIYMPYWANAPTPSLLEVRVDGRAGPWDTQLSQFHYSARGMKRHQILAEQSLGLDPAYTTRFPKGSGTELKETVQRGFWVKALNWLDYSPYDVVAVNEVQWNRLESGPRRALMRYVRNGGALLLSGDEGDTAKQASFALERVGFGVIARCPSRFDAMDRSSQRSRVLTAVSGGPHP